MRYRRALSRLLDYCATENYRGYSLYDSHSGWLPFERLGDTVSFYGNQLVKRSPINFRPLLGVKKGTNPKGLGLFLRTLCHLSHHAVELPGVEWRSGTLEGEIRELYKRLIESRSSGYAGSAWGYNFDWPKRDGSLVPAYTPSSVVTGFNARAVFDYYRLTGADSAATLLEEAAEFIRTEIPTTETEDGLCFSYTPGKRDITYNANLLAAEVLAYTDLVQGTREHEGTIKRVLSFTFAHQREDGSWYYSKSLEDGSEKKQVDFHQGYVVESCYRLKELYGIDFPYEDRLRAGVEFYREEQFDRHGRGYWRWPRRWPVDIHNQSQGIITLAMFGGAGNDYISFAEKIARWTIDSMQCPDGHFAYQKWPLLTNKISYMRWAQGWMAVALATLLPALEG